MSLETYDRVPLCPPVAQLATNEKVVYLLGQHVLRLSKLQFTPYERSVYRRRAVAKWASLVPYDTVWPALAVWLLSKQRRYVPGWFCARRAWVCLELQGPSPSPPPSSVTRQDSDDAMLSEEGRRQKDAQRAAMALTVSTNR